MSKSRAIASTADPSNLPAEIAAELADLSTADLRRELTRALDLTAHNMLRLALIVRALEERGEDLTDLKIGMLGHLRRIAYGQVLPEVVVRYAEYPTLMRRIESLPLPDQRRLAAGEPVPVVVRSAEGAWTHRLIDPLHLTADQTRTVFGPSGLRDEAEQIAVIESRPPRAPGRRPVRVGRVVADPARKALRIGKSYAPQAEILEALAHLRGGGASLDGEPEAQANVKLTEAEHAHLKQVAMDGNTTLNALIRRALIVAGLIGSAETP